MSEQHKYYTLTEDVKTLIQYIQEQAIDHSVVEAANRLNKAIEKGVDVGLAAVTINKSRDLLEKERKQYEEDSKTHEKPWELWEYAVNDPYPSNWYDLKEHPQWANHYSYRRKIKVFVPEYYSGLNWKDAEGLLGKIIESTDCPSQGWKIGRLTKVQDGKKGSGLFEVYDREHGTSAMYEYIRTVEEILVPEHPTINIGGVELPMPETVAPANGTKYWTFSCSKYFDLFSFSLWSCTPTTIVALQAGQVHLTEGRAKAWADWWKKEVLAKIDEVVS